MFKYMLSSYKESENRSGVIKIYQQGAPSVLQYTKEVVPEPGPGQVQVRQAAIGLNFIDTYYDLISEIANKSQRDQVRRNQIAEEHIAIAKAIANRDKAEAKQAVLHHMSMVDKKVESMD